MASITFCTALIGLASVAQSHMTFGRLAHNGEWQNVTRFIRNQTEPFTEPTNPQGFHNRGWVSPTYVTDLPQSIRCGRDNMNHALDTEVLKVKAGDNFEFLPFRFSSHDWRDVKDVQWENCPENRGGCKMGSESANYIGVGHEGPVVVHLSKPPTGKDVRTYDGSGEWVKIHTLGLEIRPERYAAPIVWLPLNNGDVAPRFTFKIPAQTPKGQYLLRIDQIWPALYEEYGEGKEPRYYEAQLYPACAQIEVTDSAATGELPAGIKIPEGLSKLSPGMFVTSEQYYLRKVDPGYVYPGGPLWDGEKLVEDKAPSM